MKVAIMQPYFLPYLGYWQLINAVDIFVLYDDVSFIKKGWINRNRIIVGRKEYMFTLPLQKVSQNRNINDHFFAGQEGKVKLWKTVKSAYSHSPMWTSVSELFEKMILNPEENIAAYIERSILDICRYLDISTKIMISSDIKKEEDLKGQDKIIYICKKLGADAYVNPAGGTDLYHDENFKSNGLKLEFLFPVLNKYTQNSEVFIPGLSILDMICNMEREEVKIQLKSFNLMKGETV